jgi:hypothetical protein
LLGFQSGNVNRFVQLSDHFPLSHTRLCHVRPLPRLMEDGLPYQARFHISGSVSPRELGHLLKALTYGTWSRIRLSCSPRHKSRLIVFSKLYVLTTSSTSSAVIVSTELSTETNNSHIVRQRHLIVNTSFLLPPCC